MLNKHGRKVRDIAVNLYKYDYLNQDDINNIMQGKKIDKKEVREYDPNLADYLNRL